MKQISVFRSFLVISAVFFPSVDSESGTWFEAQRVCAKQNKTLPTDFPSSQVQGNRKSKTYWTSYSQRKSNWTQLLGCYPATKVSDADKTVSMSISSVGMCQEICTPYSSFAVKFTTCICLQSFPSADQGRLPIDHCNRSCGDIPSQPFTQQCGGEDAYNVYRSINFMGFGKEKEGMCLSIQCAESKDAKFYSINSCTKTYYPACEKAEENVQFANWTSSMKFCETKLSSYLVGGDLLLTNPTSDCTKIMNVSKSPSGANWIAVARQIYISIDQGHLTINKGDFTACKQCIKNNCSYVPCSTPNEFICSDKVDSSTSTHSVSSKTELSLTPTTSADTESKTSITTTSDKSTSRYHSTSSNVEITTPMSGSVDKNVSAFTTTTAAVIFTHHSSSFEMSTPVSGSVDKSVSDQKEIVAAIVTPIVVLLGAVIVFGVIYFRRCKGNATSETARSKQMEAKNLESNQYTYVDSSNNNAYFVLEPGSHISELDDTTKAESESPYNDLPEGEYDLLRDKDSRRKVSDDTYATSAKTSDYSDYDVTNRNRQTEEDSTYDHAGSNTTSLYGYGSVQHQEQDENAYSTSEY